MTANERISEQESPSHTSVLSLADRIPDPYCRTHSGVFVSFVIVVCCFLFPSSSLSSEDGECAKSKNPYNPRSSTCGPRGGGPCCSSDS